MQTENSIASSLIKYRCTIAYYYRDEKEIRFSLELFFDTIEDAHEVMLSFGRGVIQTLSYEDNLEPESNFVQLLIPNITGEEILSVMQVNIIISPTEN
jgi:hypothetical protein